MSIFENNKQEYSCYMHEALENLAKQRKEGKISVPEYLQATTNLLDKTYNKNSMCKQIKSGRIF